MLKRLNDLLDLAALRWLNGRVERAASQMNDDGWRFHQATASEMEIINKSRGVFLLAEEAARLLEAHHAQNYVQVDLLPRLTREIRPVRLTVQWAHGKSPAAMNTALRAALKKLIDASDDSEWHSSEDCRTEGRIYRICHLCTALQEARALLPEESADATSTD